jgi:hypothetical protein
MELGELGEWIGNIWKVLKCGAGEGCVVLELEE